MPYPLDVQVTELNPDTAKAYVKGMMEEYGYGYRIDTCQMMEIDGQQICRVIGVHLGISGEHAMDWAVWIESDGQLYGEW